MRSQPVARLVLGREVHSVPVRHLFSHCAAFDDDPSRIKSPIQIRSEVTPEELTLFITALSGSPITLTATNAPRLALLAREFGFGDLSGRISAFLCSAEARIPDLEAKMQQQSREIADLKASNERLRAEVADSSRCILRIQDTLREHDSMIRGRESPVSPPAHSADVRGIPAFDSSIVSGLPPLFSDWASRTFRLLYRTRDGFAAKDFHRQCDGHAPTIVFVLTPEGFCFGGYTPCTWASDGGWQRDDRQESFLFTLHNPHGIEPRKFAIKEDRRKDAVFCKQSEMRFGGGPDLRLSEKSYTGGFGITYLNDTGIDGSAFFTGARNFTVKEVEVFEIGDSEGRPPGF
jgi:hypothetical protein